MIFMGGQRCTGGKSPLKSVVFNINSGTKMPGKLFSIGPAVKF